MTLGRFWPAPLIQLNHNFEPGGYIDDLVADGALDAECAKIFRLKRPTDTSGERLLLHRHQADAIEIAHHRHRFPASRLPISFPSSMMCCAKRAGDDHKGISAIVVYPMNALCNSQREELERYLRIGYGAGIRGGSSRSTPPSGSIRARVAAARLRGPGFRPTTSRRISRASSSIERPLSAAYTRNRVFTSSSRLRIVMLATASAPHTRQTANLRGDCDAIKPS